MMNDAKRRTQTMASMTTNFSQYSSIRNQEPLTLEQIARYAPSAVATRAHESRSSRYTYIPTLDVIAGMRDAGFVPFKASQSRTKDESRREFTKHMIRFRHMDLQSIAVGEHVPEIVLINSHDGTSAYKLMAGIFPLVCSHGMVVAESMLASITVSHVGDVVRNVINGSLELTDRVPAALQTIERWGQLQLTSGERNAFAESAHMFRFADENGQATTPITPAQLLETRRSDDDRSDLWHTFNTVQENVIRGGLRGRTARTPENPRGRRVTTRPVNGIDQDVKLNRALWQLAERMAELKAAA